MGRKNKSGSSSRADQAENVTNYFKLVATFKCSKEECRHSWTSVHGWGNEDECNSNCEVCKEPAELVGARDEDLTKDIYICPKKDCKESWEVIHSKKDPVLEECNSCGTSTSPNRSDKTKGRRYTFQCKNENCKEKPKWNEFSQKTQILQRCNRTVGVCKIGRGEGYQPIPCGSGGILIRIKNKQIVSRGGNEEGDGGGGNGRHIADLCDMCQQCKNKNLRYRTCHRYRMAQLQLNDQGDDKILGTLIFIK